MTRKSSIHSEDGQAVAEFALVLPVLLAILIAIVQLGLVLHDYLSLTDGVRVGAREVAVTWRSGDPRSIARNAVAAATGLDESRLAVETTPGPWAPGAKVRVVAEYPYSLNLFGLPVKSGRLRSETTVRVE